MKIVALLLCLTGLLFAEDREGNFEIRFEPTAKLQTNVDVPFEIRINDARHKPLPPESKVTMTVQLTDGTHKVLFKAPGVQAGLYIAKPKFPVAGTWDVTVTVNVEGQYNNRTSQFNVVE